MIDERIARKMGVDIIRTMEEITRTPQDNLKRFQVLKKRLGKQVEKYSAYTGRSTLDPETVAYAEANK